MTIGFSHTVCWSCSKVVIYLLQTSSNSETRNWTQAYRLGRPRKAKYNNTIWGKIEATGPSETLVPIYQIAKVTFQDKVIATIIVTNFQAGLLWSANALVGVFIVIFVMSLLPSSSNNAILTRQIFVKFCIWDSYCSLSAHSDFGKTGTNTKNYRKTSSYIKYCNLCWRCGNRQQVRLFCLSLKTCVFYQSRVWSH